MPMMTARMLLKSCADPTVQLTDGLHLLRAWRSCFSSATRSVMSRPTKKCCWVRFRPHALPAQRDDAAVLVDVAAIEIAHEPAAARACASPRACCRDRRDRGSRVALCPIMLLGPIAEDRLRELGLTRMKLPLLVDDQDEIERGFEDALVDRADRFPLALAGRHGSVAPVLGARNARHGIDSTLRESAFADQASTALIVHRITPPANDIPPCHAGLLPRRAA